MHREARTQVMCRFRELHDNTPDFQRAQNASVASVLGIRESRHIEGQCKITVEDVAQGTKFSNRIAVYAFGMDVHIRAPEMSGNFKIEIADTYYIPYCSMLPLNCNNLLVADKTISYISQAAGGLRCMPCAMSMGQAAGIACHLALRDNVSPNVISVNELQDELRKAGAILD